MVKIKFNFGKLHKLISLCLVQIILFASLAFSNFGSTVALANPLVKEAESPPREVTRKPVDLDRAASKANEASDKVFDSLEETQRLIGNEERDKGLKEAREHASKKWEALADKANNSSNSTESLTPPDRKMLQHVQGES